MRTSELVLSLALATSVGVSLWLWNELRAERANQTALERDPLAVAIMPVESGEPGAIAIAAPTKVSPATAESTSSTSTPAQKPSTKVVAGEDEGQTQRRMLQDSRYRAAWREEYRLNLGLRRENIIRLIGLTPEQADAVIDLQVDRLLSQIEDPRALNEHYQANERAHNAKLTELLGQEKSARLQEYMESRATRMQVDQFRNLLGGQEMLRDDQVEPLIAALHTENAQLKRDLDEYRQTLMLSGDAENPWRQFGERRLEMEKEAHARMLAAAAPVLSRSQIEKFDAMLERDRERRAAEQRMQGLQSKLAPGVAAPD